MIDPATEPVQRTRVRVRYAETDQMRVVYYANYFVWFEVGRTDWLRQAGWTYRQMEQDGVSLPVIEAAEAPQSVDPLRILQLLDNTITD